MSSEHCPPTGVSIFSQFATVAAYQTEDSSPVWFQHSPAYCHSKRPQRWDGLSKTRIRSLKHRTVLINDQRVLLIQPAYISLCGRKFKFNDFNN